MMALGLVETRGLVGAIEGADAMLKAADVRLLDRSLVGGGLVTITVAGAVSAVQASVEAAQACIVRIPGTQLVSVHVIPRPDGQLETILKLDPDPNDGAPAPKGGSGGPVAPADPADPGKPGSPEPAGKQAPEASAEPAPGGSSTSPAGTTAPETKAVPAKPGPVFGEAAEPAQPAADTPPGAADNSARSEDRPATGSETAAPAGEDGRPRYSEESLKKMSLGALRSLARKENIVLGGKGIAQASKKALIQALVKTA